MAETQRLNRAQTKQTKKQYIRWVISCCSGGVNFCPTGKSVTTVSIFPHPCFPSPTAFRPISRQVDSNIIAFSNAVLSKSSQDSEWHRSRFRRSRITRLPTFNKNDRFNNYPEFSKCSGKLKWPLGCPLFWQFSSFKSLTPKNGYPWCADKPEFLKNF